MAELKAVNLKIDPAVWQEAKIAAIKQNKLLMAFVAEALLEKIARDKE